MCWTSCRTTALCAPTTRWGWGRACGCVRALERWQGGGGFLLPHHHSAALPPPPHSLCLPARLQWNLTGLVEMIFDYLKLIRIYTKPKGEPPARLLASVAALHCCSACAVLCCTVSLASPGTACLRLPSISPHPQASCPTGMTRWCCRAGASRWRTFATACTRR